MSFSWHERYLRIAEEVATWSKDSTKVGAVIVGEGGIVATGFNGFPRGVLEGIAGVEYRSELDEKNEWTVHAEANAILNAARHGVSTLGTTMYAKESTCHRCAGMVVQAGIARLVLRRAWTNYSWRDPNGESIARAYDILKEGEVEVIEGVG